ncbi:MAG: hypothetical protein ACI8Y4_005169 [Candidatus Poriferisodalaceae bacterium]|jgi:hypothetical protein
MTSLNALTSWRANSAHAVLEAEDLAAKDRQFKAGYRRQPADPALVASTRRLAAQTTPAL